MGFNDLIKEQGGNLNIGILPKCAMSNCEEKGIVYCLGKYICGKCLLRIQEKLKEQQNELFQQIDGGKLE